MWGVGHTVSVSRKTVSVSKTPISVFKKPVIVSRKSEGHDGRHGLEVVRHLVEVAGLHPGFNV